MSNRPLTITKRQAKTFLKAAEEAGGKIEVDTPIGVVRFIPAVIANQNDPVDEVPKGRL